VPGSFRQRASRWGVEDVLRRYPELRLAPASQGVLRLIGTLRFSGRPRGKESIDDEYEVDLSVPDRPTQNLPIARETRGRIPDTQHKNPDGSLCLGSPTRLRLAIHGAKPLLSFVENCLIPYLYGYSYFERHAAWPFGELKHGEEGIHEDFASLFGIGPDESVEEFVRLAAMKKRLANRARCPCESGRRVGRCHGRRINQLRKRLGRVWFRFVLDRRR
jgi:hypothetical protein